MGQAYTRLQHFILMTSDPIDLNVFYCLKLIRLARHRKMGSQGNYKGSGAINEHAYLAMRGHTEHPGGSVQAENMEKGSGSGIVGAVNMKEGVTELTPPETASKDIRANNHNDRG